MRIAIVADIHSNLPAFEAVLADIATQGVDEIIAAGDMVNAGAFPCEVMQAIHHHKIPMVRGNHEQYLLDFRHDTARFPRPQWNPVRWTYEQFTPAEIDFFGKLPLQIDRDRICIVHASPHDMNRGVLPSTPATQLEECYGKLPHQVIVTAHTHLPFTIHWRDKLIVNPGSVGIPLDGNPAASYVILTQHCEQVLVQHRRVAYDHLGLAEAYAKTGFMECGIIAEMLLKESMHARIYVVPYLRQLYKIIEARGVDFVGAMAHVQEIQPDLSYGSLEWKHSNI